MSLKEKSKKKNNELSFTQKCIILANIQNETDKILINSFYFMPVVKLYTSSIKQDIFSYTKIKGALLLFQDKNIAKKNYYLRIYDINDYSLRFNLEISNETKKNYVKNESNFYCFILKLGFIGFQFSSDQEAEMFKKIFDIGVPDQITNDQYEELKRFPLTDSDNIYLNVIDDLIEQFGKKYGIIFDEKYEQKIYQVADY